MARTVREIERGQMNHMEIKCVWERVNKKVRREILHRGKRLNEKLRWRRGDRVRESGGRSERGRDGEIKRRGSRKDEDKSWIKQ